jgi:hypothetical protein
MWPHGLTNKDDMTYGVLHVYSQDPYDSLYHSCKDRQLLQKKMVSDSRLSGIQSSSIRKRKYFLHPKGKNYSVSKSLTLTKIIQASKKLIVGSDVIHGAFI